MKMYSPIALSMIFFTACGCVVSSGRYKKLDEERAAAQERCGKLEGEAVRAGKKAEELRRRIGLMEKTIAVLKEDNRELQAQFEQIAAECVTIQVECRELLEEYRALKGGAAAAVPSKAMRTPGGRALPPSP